MKKWVLSLILLVLAVFNLIGGDPVERFDKNIGITKLTDKIYLMQSSFACNGHLDCNHLIIADSNDMVLINTPATDSLTAIMINFIEKKFKRKITKLIVSHFHDDSAGGLDETDKRGIIAYGLNLTSDLLKPAHKNIDVVFRDSMTIPLQTLKLELFYLGAGHSVDNIVTWIPGEKILFGGCLIKSLDTNDKGNVRDADMLAWPLTVQKVKERFKDARVVIPGHLSIGDSSLFDHTINIVKSK